MNQDPRPSIQISTFGCKVNTYDSGLLEKRFREKGFALAEKPQVFVLNSCAVTAEATRETLKSARRLKKENPEAIVVVTGCSAQVDTEKISTSTDVDLVVANSHKGDIENIIFDKWRGLETERVYKSNIFKKDDLEFGGGEEESHTRSFLKIQDGCNSFCTFCVIPFARGKSRSIEIARLRDRVDELLAEGAKEIVLTGVHIGDYEFGLENLIEEILLKTRVPRLRLTSLEPIELNDRLFEFFQDPRMCPHFHMSIQSASTFILERMKRKYTAQEVERALLQIQKKVPQAFVGMDVIVGFPGENEEEFLQTYDRLNSLPWTRIHVFPYSERPNTYAQRLDQKLDSNTIHRYADRLRELSFARVTEAARQQVGQSKRVLVLKGARGLARDYWPVEFTGPSESQALEQINSEVNTTIRGYRMRSNGEPILSI